MLQERRSLFGCNDPGQLRFNPVRVKTRDFGDRVRLDPAAALGISEDDAQVGPDIVATYRSNRQAAQPFAQNLRREITDILCSKIAD